MYFKRTVSMLLASFIVVLAFGLTYSVLSQQPGKSAASRGELLAADCHACHSPKIFTPTGPQPDPDRLFAGYPAGTKMPDVPEDLIAPQKWGGLFTNDLTAWVGPWGVSFGTNLTPDEETGIGNWSLDIFKEVLRTGMVHDGSRRFLPPMPTEVFPALSDSDLKDMYDYFMSLKPVANKVPDPIPPDKIGLTSPPPPGQ